MSRTGFIHGRAVRLLVLGALVAGALVAAPAWSPPASAAAADPVWFFDDTPRQLLPDEAHGLLFVLGYDHLTALSLVDGSVASTSPLGGTQIVLAPDGSALFLVGDAWIKRLNPMTLAVSATIDAACPSSLSLLPPRAWVTTGCDVTGTLQSFLSASASPAFGATTFSVPASSRSVPGSDGQTLFLFNYTGAIQRYQVSGDTASSAGQATAAFGITSITTDPVANTLLVSDGEGGRILDQTDLHRSKWSLPFSGEVAASPSDLAYLSWSSGSTYAYSRAGWWLGRILPTALCGAWLSDGTALVANVDPGGSGWVRRVPDADRARTTTAITAAQGSLEAGRLTVFRAHMMVQTDDSSSTPSVPGVTVALQRIEPGGAVTTLATTTTNSDGGFRIVTRPPDEVGRVTYAFAFEGTDAYLPSTTSLSFPVWKPWDFNSDGYADVAVGAPGEDVGAAVNAGAVTVLYGTAVGASATGGQLWTQDSPGLPGKAETGDQFGYSLASADYNGDGYADLAIGANTEGLKGAPKAGSVTVLRGGSAGLSATGVTTPGAQHFSARKYFGESLASGDFDADHVSDLAVGYPGAETVEVFHGNRGSSPPGLRRLLDEGSAGVPGTGYAGETLGESVTSGDFNGDGFGDLAYGAPLDIDGRSYSSGAVFVSYGGSEGIKGPGTSKWTLDTSGLAGTPARFSTSTLPDFFGSVLASGDVNRDGYDDVAIGSPGEDVGTHVDAGAAHVLLGSSAGVSASSSRRITQDTTGVPGGAERSDRFGASLALGLDRASAAASLAIRSVGDQTVTVLPAAKGSGVQMFSQETPGVPGGTEPEDFFGEFLRYVDVAGGGPANLLIGVPGENRAAGSLILLAAGAGGPSGTGAALISQDSAGVPGSSERGDYWGWLNSAA